MKVPSNMSEQEVTDTITKVARSLAPKFTFAFYDIEDFVQEAFMIGVEALDRYNESKPLENFLYTHIANRLKNFKRDNYFRQDEGNAHKIQNRKKNLLNAANIENFGSIGNLDDSLDEVYIAEIKKIIDQKLPSDLRGDYLRMCAGDTVPKNKKEEIAIKIKEILGHDETG